MRIRKNIKNIPPLGLFLLPDDDNNLGSARFVCQLNQSPWDVIPFSSSSSSSSSPYHHQLGKDDNGFVAAVNGGAFVGSVGPIESDEKPIVGFHNEGLREIVETDGESSGPVVKIECAKTDGKFWKCKRESKEGHHFCEHHILQLKSYSRGGAGNGEKPGRANGAGAGRTRAARKKKSETSSSDRSNQYYYYSGFGPLWGKKQGDSRLGRDSAEARGASEGLNYLHFEDGLEDEDGEEATMGEGNKKRERKPIKARSLKSLM